MKFSAILISMITASTVFASGIKRVELVGELNVVPASEASSLLQGRIFLVGGGGDHGPATTLKLTFDSSGETAQLTIKNKEPKSASSFVDIEAKCSLIEISEEKIQTSGSLRNDLGLAKKSTAKNVRAYCVEKTGDNERTVSIVVNSNSQGFASALMQLGDVSLNNNSYLVIDGTQLVIK